MFDFYPWLWRSPNDGGGNGSEGDDDKPKASSDTGESPKGEPGAPEEPEGAPPQPEEGETVPRAKYEAVDRERKRLAKEKAEREAAEKKAAEEAAKKRGEHEQLLKDKERELEDTRKAHGIELKRRDARMELIKLGLVDDDAIYLFERFEGYDAEDADLSALAASFKEAKPHLFADQNGNVGTQKGQGDLKGKAPDYDSMSAKEFEEHVTKAKQSA